MPTLKSKKIDPDKIQEKINEAKENPYVHKVLEDKEFRENALAALQSVKAAFDEAKEKGFDDPAGLVQDKKIKKHIKSAADGITDTRSELLDAGKKKKRKPLRKLLAIAVIGGVVAFVVSEDVRKSVLDALFGAEEEFEYTSSTSASPTSSNGTS